MNNADLNEYRDENRAEDKNAAEDKLTQSAETSPAEQAETTPASPDTKEAENLLASQLSDGDSEQVNTDNFEDIKGDYPAGMAPDQAAAADQPEVAQSRSESVLQKNPPFYTEKYRKPRGSDRHGVLKLIAVGLVCSILGGLITAVFMTALQPVISPLVERYIGKISSTKVYTPPQNGSYGKIEIVGQTDSVVAAVAAKVGPSVVGIRVTYPANSLFFGQNMGVGSGIIIREDGYIMTNNHVISNVIDSNTGKIRNGAKIEVFLPSRKDEPLEAEVVGTDWKTDLAVIKINAEGLQAAILGDSDKLKVGEVAVAIGNPAGLEFMGSVTAGVISGLERNYQVEGGGEELKLIQTDASINRGNSGGALANSRGEVIGINTLKAGEGFEGMGFAIPVNKAKEIVESLINLGYVQGRPPVLNVLIATDFTAEVAKKNGLPEGLWVEEVIRFGAAYRAGIRANDIITKFDGQRVKTIDELYELRKKHKPGDVVDVEVYRNGETLKFKVELAEDKG